jgi:vacuolar-type H+-ATPase subunit E/Vma4
MSKKKKLAIRSAISNARRRSLFEGIKAGLEDAIAYARGDKLRGITHRPEDIAARRKQEL